MKRSVQLLTLAAAGIVALMALGGGAPAQAPGPGPGNPQPNGPKPQQKNIPTVAMSFRNDLDKPVIIQGHSIVGGVQRRGQPIPVPAGKVNFDNNVPVGVRFVSVFDGNQPSRILVRNVPVPVPLGRDVKVLISQSPNNPDRILVVPDNGK